MTRVLRYPRMSALLCALTFLCAISRDLCLSAGLAAWGRALLPITVLLLILTISLLSCRFFVDVRGVGVGFLLHVRRTDWEDLQTLGLLCCNGRRLYLYGLYKTSPDFLRMLHFAPRCGRWGFVAPLSGRLRTAIATHCPFRVDLTPPDFSRRPKTLHALWRQAVLFCAVCVPCALLAFVTAAHMLLLFTTEIPGGIDWSLMLGAALLCAAGLLLLYRAFVTFATCPCIGKEGVSAGRALFLPWSEVRFSYLHRHPYMSGLFLLSAPLDAAAARGCAPVLCLSLPGLHTLMIAYANYSPHVRRSPIRR